MTEEEITLNVRGMPCDSCAAHVEDALRHIEGVLYAEVPGWESEQATVRAQAGVTAEALSAAVQEAGYTAAVKTRQPVGGPVSGDGKGGDYNLIVIGAGSAGFAAAIKGAELGYSVALVEAGTIGGTCVNIGCVPSKTLICAMETYHGAGQSRFRGVHTASGGLNWPQVIAHKDELVLEMRQRKYVDVLAAYPEVTYIQGYARLTGKNGVEIDGNPYTADKIVIATGASPWAPPIPGLDTDPESGFRAYLDSTSALDLKELPKSMIVLGANAVGLELAQTYARAGTYVTVLELLPRIAPYEDEEVSAALAEYLEQEGLRIVTAFQTTRVEKRGGRYLLTGMLDGAETAFETEQLLVATGRRPNTAGFGLEEAGVKLGEKGEILVNEFLQTDNPYVYAAGDVLGQDMFVYVAAYGATVAAENALTDAGRVYDTRAIPRITFTYPQIASAGLTEAEAREGGYQVKVSTLPLAHVPRALAARETRGLIKLVADEDTDRLLGAHVLAAEASEVIQTAVLALQAGYTTQDLAKIIFPYLTMVEGLKLAAQTFEKDVAMLSCCAG